MIEKLKSKKVVYTIIGIISMLLVAAGITYAYWLITKSQTGENVITTGCLDISLSNEQNDINLTNQFPMSDEEGMELTPYTFTVTNNCNTSVDYQIALEAIGEESASIASNALKVALNDNAGLFSSYAEVDTTVSGAYEARRLGFSRLASKGSEGATDSYELRIWIDANADISEMNKSFASKISITIGQGIENPYEEGTLAYDILANNGGSEGIQTLNADWYELEPSEETTLLISKSENYWYGTEYEFDRNTGKFSLSGDLIQATSLECREGTKKCGKYTIKNTESTLSSRTLYIISSFENAELADTKYAIYYNVQSKTSENTFIVSPTTDLYKAQDDLGDSYYFRGTPTNNYVKFGTYESGSTLTFTDVMSENWDEKTITFKEETPMYWRIVRINGDGTIRLVYDGTSLVANGISHNAIIANMTEYAPNNNLEDHVGYTFDDGTGTQVDSTVKTVVDGWYENNLKKNYGSYIADSIFCNDRNVEDYFYNDGNDNETTEDKAYGRDILYGPNVRFENKSPELTCTNKADRYTKDDTTNGNGLLENPVGLLTLDEVVLSGYTGTNKNVNKDNYLYIGSVYDNISENYSTGVYFTMSPSRWYSGPWWPEIFAVSDSQMISENVIDYSDVRPVINLRANVKFTGDGSFETPYEIVME